VQSTTICIYVMENQSEQIGIN